MKSINEDSEGKGISDDIYTETSNCPSTDSLKGLGSTACVKPCLASSCMHKNCLTPVLLNNIKVLNL